MAIYTIINNVDRRLGAPGAPRRDLALARAGSGENARRMRLGSKWLQDLKRSEAVGVAAPTTSIYTWDGSIVAP